MPNRMDHTTQSRPAWPRVILAGVAVLMAGIMAGCHGPASTFGQQQLELARQYYDQGDYHTAIRTLTRFLDAEGSSREAGLAHYLRGLSWRQLALAGDGTISVTNQKAEQDLLATVKTSTRNESLRALAWSALGHLYFETRGHEPQTAAEAYTNAIQTAPDRAINDLLLYRRGLCLQKLGQWRQADRDLALVIKNDTAKLANRARQRFGATRWRLLWGQHHDYRSAREQYRQYRHDTWGMDIVTVKQPDGELLYKVLSERYNTYQQAATAAQAFDSVDIVVE